MAAESDADAPPISRTSFGTRDPEETTEFFRQAYVGNRTTFSEVDPRGGFSAQCASPATMRADRLRGALTMDVTAAPLGCVLVGRLQAGEWMLRSRGEEVRLGPGDSVLYPVDAVYEGHASRFDFHLVRLPLHGVGELAAAHSGIDPGDLRFDSMQPVSAAMARHLGNTVALVHRELGEPDSAAAHPLVAEHLAQTVAAAVLATFPNTTMTTAMPTGGHVAPAALRRAVAYIDEHAGDPITVGDVAAAAGIGERALQHAFRRHRGTSPMGHLRLTRLDRAHRELRAADPTGDVTVAEVAARWGFANPGRFAAAYRDAYGRSPGRTLRT